MAGSAHQPAHQRSPVGGPHLCIPPFCHHHHQGSVSYENSRCGGSNATVCTSLSRCLSQCACRCPSSHHHVDRSRIVPRRANRSTCSPSTDACLDREHSASSRHGVRTSCRDYAQGLAYCRTGSDVRYITRHCDLSHPRSVGWDRDNSCSTGRCSESLVTNENVGRCRSSEDHSLGARTGGAAIDSNSITCQLSLIDCQVRDGCRT